MSRGKSGLLIASIDPTLKKQLYSRLAAEGQTYKDWLLQRLDRYLGQEQLPLYAVDSPPASGNTSTIGNGPATRPRKRRRS
jgi:hypothetical protein